MTEQFDLENTDAIEAAQAEEDSRRDRVRLILIVSGVALATILLVGTVALAVATRSWVKSERIAPYVTVAGLEVGGMTRDEAVGTLRDRWVPTLPDAVKVTFPGGEWDARREELGVALQLDVAAQHAVRVGREGGLTDQIRARLRAEPIDIAVPVQIDKDTLDDAIGALAQTVDRDPVDATFTVRGTQIDIIPGKDGRLLDIDATMKEVSEALANPAATEVAAVVETRRPSITEEDLAHIEVVLAEFSTPYRQHQVDRTHNLKLASKALNEKVVRPGQVFSFNENVGRRSAEGGYRPADIFLEGDVTPQIGGGICQIASTLYNIALLSNMDIVERRRHSRPVDYVAVGRDATVYWGQQDFKFKSPLKHPAILLTDVSGGRVTFKMLGSRADKVDVEITREGLTRIPHEERRIDDPELEEGKTEVETEGRDGWRVTVHRKVTRDGKVLREQRLHTDHYPPQTKVVRVGTKPPEIEEPEEVEAPTEDRPDPPSETAPETEPSAEPPPDSSRSDA